MNDLFDLYGKVVCFCGSISQEHEMYECAHMLERRGAIVILPFDHATYPQDSKSDNSIRRLSKSEIKDMEIKKHNKKIDISDYVCIFLKPDGSMGESTTSELAYACSKGKKILCYTSDKHDVNTINTGTKVITLCGSGKFINDFHTIESELTKAGHIVLVPDIFRCMPINVYLLTKSQHKLFDEIHTMKLQLADLIAVVSTEGYIGSNTKSEIEYACMLNTPVIYIDLSKGNSEITRVLDEINIISKKEWDK